MTEAATADGTRFHELLAWSYRGEVAGQVLFAVLATGFADTGHGPLFERLGELERLMADALRSQVDEHGVDVGDEARLRAGAERGAAAAVAAGWDALVGQFESVTEDALGRYRELRSLAGDGAPIWDLLIAHEDAIQAVGRRLDAGATDGLHQPVDDVIERLQHHLARPTSEAR